MKKRIIAIILMLCLGVTMVPTMAFAGNVSAVAATSVASVDECDDDQATQDGEEDDSEDEDEDDDEDDDDDEDEDDDDDDEDEESEEVSYVRISSVNYNTNNGTAPVYKASVADGAVSLVYEGWKGSDGTVSYSSAAAYGDDDDVFTTFKEGITYTYCIRLAVNKNSTLADTVSVQLNDKQYTGTINKSKNIITVQNVYSAKSVCKHYYKKTVVKPTCTASGYSLHTCKYCGTQYRDAYTAATGHQWVINEKKTTPATQYEDGTLAYKCSAKGCTATKNEVIPRIKSITLSCTSYTYNGQVRKPAVKIVDSKGATISNSNFNIEYSNYVNAGTASVTISTDDEDEEEDEDEDAEASVARYKIVVDESDDEDEDESEGIVRTYKINPASQTITAKVTSKTYKKSTVAKKSQSFSVGAKAKNKVSYKSSSKKVTVSSSGKVTVKKKTSKGTYKITVTAAKSRNYKAATKTIKVKVS